MSRAIKQLIARLLAEVRDLTDALEAGGVTVAAWRDAFGAALARYHAAALMVGQGDTTLTPQGRRALRQTVRAQLRYLDRFAIEIQGAATFQRGWQARAALYAQGIGQSYWRGATRMLPLPAMPRDGTSQCLTNCTCAWEIVELDGDGNYDCYWRLGATERHCQTCPQRATEWSPLRIRGGVIQ